MAISSEKLLSWSRALLGVDHPPRSLEDYLAAIPRLDSLAELPRGTAVLVRGDVDAKPGEKVGQGDERLRSMVETLKYGIQRGWKQIIFGHIGRKPEGSLKAVAARFRELLGQDVQLLDDWLDDATGAVSDTVAKTIQSASPGSVLLLENTRKYKLETCLWGKSAEKLPPLMEKLTRYANEMASKVAKVYVHEAFSAGSLDASSVIVPAAMDRVALGNYAAGEFDGPLRRCLKTELVIFSGIKIDKLDDLQAMIDRGTVKYVLTAGSLAMALRKGAAELDGQQVCLGVAEDRASADKPIYIPPERVKQAKQMIAAGRGKGIEFILPVDSIQQDGRPVDTLGPADQQFDVGPKTSALFEERVGEILKRTGGKVVVFHNGVFGMFEDPRFEEGTRRFIGQLKRMKDAGAEVYVGGGEGGTALKKYGQPDWVTHCFTAGGTVLNALGSSPVPYLQALQMAARR
ncbi:MAG TPA: phosphoglycerate kinase [Pirellulales bacterium]|jgi:phosphoglycerate kinase|nr:phosphoglycerate kinase [Pirellulales bacterium]